MSVRKNFVWNASYQLLLLLVPLVTAPYLSRTLGASQIGVYSYTYSIASYFLMFATLGMANYGVRVIAAAGSDRKARSRVFWSAYCAQLCVGVPVTIIYIAFLFLFNQSGGLTVGLAWSLLVFSGVLDVSWLFFGVEDFKLPTKRSFVTKLASVVFIFAFVHGPGDLWAYCIAIAGSFFANAIIMWPFVKRYVDLARPSWREIRVHFLPNLRLFAPVMAISVYTSLDKIMLGSISGMEQAGFYEYSEKMSKMTMALVTALGTVMLPRMTAALSEGKRAEAVELLGKSIWVMQAGALAMAFGIAAVAPEFSTVFFGPGYEACASIMPIISITIPVIAASNAIGVQYMLPTFSDKPYTVSVCMGAIVNVVLNLVLLKPLGAVGAAIATVAAELSVLLYQCWKVRKDLPLMRYLISALPFVAAGLVMYLAVRGLATVLTESVAGLLIEIVCGVVVYLIAAVLFLLPSGKARDFLCMFHR